MQLDTNERALLAYFPSQASASAAFSLLKKQGYQDIRFDEVVLTNDPGDTYYVNSLSQLGGDAATDPWEAGCRWLVTVVVPSAQATQAADTLKSYGAYLR